MESNIELLVISFLEVFQCLTLAIIILLILDLATLLTLTSRIGTLIVLCMRNLTGATKTVTRLENVNPEAVSWLPVYGANYILYHNDIFNTTNYAQHDLQVLNQTGCQLVQQWGDYIYLYRVPQTFGRIYALNSSWISIESQSQPPTSEDVNASGVNII